MQKILLSYLSLLWLLIPVSSDAQTYQTKKGYVEFHSTVPLHSFTGKSKHLVGKISLQDSTVDFYVDVHTLKTGIGMRDRDMLETLDAEKNSFADFYGKIITSFDAAADTSQNVTVEGKFSVHGVSQPVTIQGTLQKADNGLLINASWQLNMSDYDIKPPGILFYRVSKTVDISISATLPKINS